MSNHLAAETSPYLLQHAENPVEWYPWCEAAFERARTENKPLFLSIGYSTCHWCHVMAEESFEDLEIADILNKYYIAIKVDREERPDIDSVYMAVCQALTGSGGWPTSIFMTPEQKPFFAGTYFPRTSRFGTMGFKELLTVIHDKWENDRSSLLHSADMIVSAVSSVHRADTRDDGSLVSRAIAAYRESFDEKYGGFGDAPKFPAPHNLLFLMQQFSKHGNGFAMEMAEKTLRQMYLGGLFDHIGYGFCRYSTDRYYLVPHFEKMLYDNALLIIAYCRAYELTGDTFYRNAAEKTADYVLSEMTSPDGGFYSAQDADSDGVEGGYYLLEPHEIEGLFGENTGAEFCEYYGITHRGNFHGKSIPNLLKSGEPTDRFDPLLPRIREYRSNRACLRKDDKILTAWNGLMIAAFCSLYRISQICKYLNAAIAAQQFIENNLCIEDTLFVSFRDGRRGSKGFLDDYASYIFALIGLYEVTLDSKLLARAERLTDKAVSDFFDFENGGFFLYGKENEQLVCRPKDCYDGAMPSGNSLMAYNLTMLKYLVPDQEHDRTLNKQMEFMSAEASAYPSGHAMFLCALSDHIDPPALVTVVLGEDSCEDLPFIVPSDIPVRIIDTPAGEYRLLDGKTAFYVCSEHACRPPMNKERFIEAMKSLTYWH